MTFMRVIKCNKQENLDTAKKIYTCSKCGVLFNWNENSQWYGSYHQLENNPEQIIYSCSEKCKI